MKTTYTFLLATLLLPGFSGCDSKPEDKQKVETAVATAEPASKPAPDNRNIDEILAAATRLHEQAITLRHAWRPTVDQLKAAQDYAAAGNSEQARTAALRAELAAQASVDQAHREQSAWRERFPN